MLRESARCLVGLIAVEMLPCVECDAGGNSATDHDATLSQFLVHLASGQPMVAAGDLQRPAEPRPRSAARRLHGHRHNHRLPALRGQSTPVAADLGNLTAELMLDLVRVRRKLARSRQ